MPSTYLMKHLVESGCVFYRMYISGCVYPVSPSTEMFPDKTLDADTRPYETLATPT